MDDMDFYEWEAMKNRSPLSKFIHYLIKAVVALIIIGTFAMIFGRIQLMKLPKSFKGITLTDAIQTSIDSENFDAVSHEPYTNYDEEGWYNVSNVAMSESAGEVQLTVRYNSRSTINTLMQKYELTERPAGEVFIYILADNKGNTYTNYTFAASSRPLYEFRRVIFTGVDLTDIDKLYLRVYYIGDVSGEGLMNASFEIYNSEYPSDAFSPKEVKPTKLTFSTAPEYSANFNN